METMRGQNRLTQKKQFVAGDVRLLYRTYRKQQADTTDSSRNKLLSHKQSEVCVVDRSIKILTRCLHFASLGLTTKKLLRLVSGFSNKGFLHALHSTSFVGGAPKCRCLI